MKRKKSIFMKSLCLMMGILMFIGLCFPATAKEAASQDPKITVAADASGITATLYNPTSSAVSVNLILTAYRPDGVMRTYQEISITVEANKTGSRTFDYRIDPYEDDLIKVFAWDQATFVPLCVEFISRLYITIDDSGAIYDGNKVTADAGVTEFSYVKVDRCTKRGQAYTATRTGGAWTHDKAENVELTLAFSPLKYTGAALPALQVSDVRLSDGGNGKRVLINVQ